MRSVTQSCRALSDPKNCSQPDSSVHGDSPGKNTRVGYYALLQGIFPTQGSNPGLWVDSLLSEPPVKPENTGVGSLSLLQGNFLSQELNWGLLHCRQILYQLSYQGSPGGVFFGGVFSWFWYQGCSGFIECLWECSFPSVFCNSLKRISISSLYVW